MCTKPTAALRDPSNRPSARPNLVQAEVTRKGAALMDTRKAKKLTAPITTLIDALTSGRPVTGLMAIEAENAVEKVIAALTEKPKG